MVIFSVVLSLCACADDENASPKNRPTQPLPFEDRVLDYQQFDQAMINKSVTNQSPTGIWMIYGKGQSKYKIDNGINGMFSGETTVNLLAVAVSLYALDRGNGVTELLLQQCSGSSPSNALSVSNNISNLVLDKFTTRLSDFRSYFALSGNLFELYLKNNEQLILDGYLAQNFQVSIVDNTSMQFPAAFSFSSSGGSFTFEFSGRKISDDLSVNLGAFKSNQDPLNEIRHSNCLNFLNSTKSYFNTDSLGSTQGSYNYQSYQAYSMEKVDSVGYALIYQASGPYLETFSPANAPAGASQLFSNYADENLSYWDKSRYMHIESSNGKALEVFSNFDYNVGFNLAFMANRNKPDQLSGNVFGTFP